MKDARSLQQRTYNIDDFRGLPYSKIIAITGGMPSSGEFRSDSRIARTWSDSAYSITLLFDKNDVCLGVEAEHASLP